MTPLLGGLVVSLLLAGFVVATVHYRVTAVDRHRRRMLQERWLAEQRLQALTRATLRAMRDEVRPR